MAIHVAIEGYDSLEQIGIGGMAAVYKARKTSIDKTVAIKILFPYLATDASFTDRFQREAKAAASIQHDNIVNVIDFGECDGSCYIVMEYYDGQTLAELMTARAGIPLDVAAQIILEVAYGLEAAHAQDIVHRDIKPGNIIYTSQGGIKIADFGLAKKTDSMTMITQHGKVIGTPAYMSPEQAAGSPVGPASDVFSLGVVAYELLSRRKPFDGKTYSEVLEKIQTADPPAVANINPLIEPEFERVIARMLEKSEDERYANAGALIPDLEAAMEKSRIARERRRLAAYIRDPNSYEARNNEQAIAQCLSRGTFYLQKGSDQLDEAMLEFRRILFIDPTNERARRNLERIRSQIGDKNQTVTIDAPAGGGAHGGEETARMRPHRRPRGRFTRWMYGAGIAGAAVLVSAILWGTRGPGDASPVAGNRNAPTKAAVIDSPLLTGMDDVVESVAIDSTTTAPARGGDQHAAGQGPGVPAGSPGVRTGSSAPVTGPPAAAAAPTGAVEPVPQAASVARTGNAASEPRAGGASRPAEPAGRGTLSVFFLGGVGEFRVDGKPFIKQPPFEGVSMPAGKYRAACRMSGDSEPREISVTILPGRETVIEYETGGEPVATIEP